MPFDDSCHFGPQCTVLAFYEVGYNHVIGSTSHPISLQRSIESTNSPIKNLCIHWSTDSHDLLTKSNNSFKNTTMVDCSKVLLYEYSLIRLLLPLKGPKIVFIIQKLRNKRTCRLIHRDHRVCL